MKKEWLICTKTPQEFERDALESTASAFDLPLNKVIARFADRPFGHVTDKWHRFVSCMLPGDELWSFKTPDEMIVNKMGAIGYSILRDGEIVDTFIMIRT